MKGKKLVKSHRLDTGFRHVFCSVCGSPAPWPGQEKITPISSGCLDDDPGTRPFGHVFVGSKAPWFELSDGLPQFEDLAEE